MADADEMSLTSRFGLLAIRMLPLIVIQFFIPLGYISSIIFFIINLGILGVVAEKMIDSVERLSIKSGIPIFVIALALLPAFSALPENIVIIFGNLRSNEIGEIMIAQTLGNNLFELLIIFGLTGYLSCRLKGCMVVSEDQHSAVMRNGIIMIIGSVLLTILIIFDGVLSFVDAIVLLIFYGTFLFVVYISEKYGIDEYGTLGEALKEEAREEEVSSKGELALVLLSVLIIVFSGNFLVDDILFMMERVANFEKYAFLLMGIATAMPDFIISLVGIKKEKSELIIGTIIGGVIFDIIVSIAIQGLFNPVRFSNFLTIVFLMTTILSTIIALIYVRTHWQLKAWEAIALVSAYVILIGYVVFTLL